MVQQHVGIVYGCWNYVLEELLAIENAYVILLSQYKNNAKLFLL